MPPLHLAAHRQPGLTPDQQRLAAQYRPMACKFALQTWAGLPYWLKRAIPEDDITAAAMLGLCRAAKLFDPKRGFQFSTYLFWSVRGATAEALRQTSKQSGFSMHGHSIIGGEPVLYFSEMEAEDEPCQAEVEAEQRETAEHVAAMLDRLPARARRIVRWRYMEGETLSVIGRRVGLSKERIRQICERALGDLRRRCDTASHSA